MSTLALQLDQTLNQLDAAKRAELEAKVKLALQQVAPEVTAPRPRITQDEWKALIFDLAGSLPDFPDDFEEMPRETDRIPIE